MDSDDFAEEESDTRPSRKSVRVRPSRVGKGVFARHAFPRSAVVGEITGEIVEDVHYSSDYCFDIGDGLLLEPVAPFRFVNHSCEPNCEFDYLDFSEEPCEKQRKRVFLFALRDIQKGEQLTIDYNWCAVRAIPCLCKSPSCRGWVASQDAIESILRKEAKSAADIM